MWTRGGGASPWGLTGNLKVQEREAVSGPFAKSLSLRPVLENDVWAARGRVDLSGADRGRESDQVTVSWGQTWSLGLPFESGSVRVLKEGLNLDQADTPPPARAFLRRPRTPPGGLWAGSLLWPLSHGLIYIPHPETNSFLDVSDQPGDTRESLPWLVLADGAVYLSQRFQESCHSGTKWLVETQVKARRRKRGAQKGSSPLARSLSHRSSQLSGAAPACSTLGPWDPRAVPRRRSRREAAFRSPYSSAEPLCSPR